MLRHIKQLTKKTQRGAATIEFIPFMGLAIGLAILISTMLINK
jgi:hypothetical protein